MKIKADIFFLIVCILAYATMTFGLVRQLKNPALKAGILESSKIMTRGVR